MATTITPPTTVRNWIPSGNPIIYTFATENINPKLSYIINVNINGTQVAQLKYAVYDRNNMSIDFNRIVNDYISSDFTNDQTNPYIVQNETVAINLKVDEEYWDGSSWRTVAGGSIANVFVWYAVADFQNSRRLWEYYRNNDLTGINYFQYGRFLGVKNYVPDVCRNTVADTPYANGKPELFKDLYKIGLMTRRTMSFFTTSTWSNANKHTALLQCWCYNEKMQLTKRFGKKISFGNLTDSNYDKKVACVPVGVSELNTMTWDQTLLEAGSNTFIDETEDKYYFITLCEKNANGDIIPPYATATPRGYKWVGFEIVTCSQYKPYNILYRTTEGGWWQIRADRKHFNETKVETSIKFNPWQYGAQVELPSDATFKRVMHTTADGTITLNTDWIENQGSIREIEDMIISPQIYLVEDRIDGIKNPVYIPVVLKDTTHQIWNKNQDRLIQYEFELEEAYNKPTLR